MSRLVSAGRSGPDAARVDESASAKDPALSRIAKYIPAEILAFYTMWTQGASQLPWKDMVMPLCLAGLAAGAVLCYVYFGRFFPEAPEASRKAHKILSPLAFLVYGYTIMGAVVPDIFVAGVALMLTAVITLASILMVPKPA